MIALAFLVALQVGQWTTIPPLNVPRQEVGVAAVEGRVYVIGGIGTDQQGSKVVEIFDTQAGGWRLGPSFPIPIHHPNVAAVGSKIYVAGGCHGAINRSRRRRRSSNRSLGNHNDPGHAD